jgi:hypothetical protein
MTRKDSDVLREHGERLAKIEGLLDNHVVCELKKLKDHFDKLDGRLWALLAAVMTTLIGVVAGLLVRLL